jgi:ribosome-associated protein
MADDITIKRGLVIPEAAIHIKKARASGPGGQHVNRTESKVQLFFNPLAVSWFDEETRQRLYALAGQGVDLKGIILITCQEERDQHQNLARACEKLATLVRRALSRPKRRFATKPTRASKERRLQDKKRRADTKSKRVRVED